MLQRSLWVLMLLVGFLPLSAIAQPHTGDNEFTLSGSGSSSHDFDNNVFGTTFSLGHFLTKHTELGVRQTVNFAHSDDGGSSANGATLIFGDYHFDFDKWQPYLGVSGGGIYGENVHDSLAAGIDAGVKYYVLRTTFIGLQTNYQLVFNNLHHFGDTFSEGQFYYSLGIGYNF